MTALADLVAANRAGKGIGIPSWCTAHADTLRAILVCYKGSTDNILIEATCNQVNQHGGYTGMTPTAFRVFVEGLTKEAGVPPSQLVLGGDHLGPNPWKSLPAAAAMTEAKALVRDFVAAGFTKIHLDASMACADDKVLTDEQRAERSAELCSAAEAAGNSQHLSYVIGTEVPVPGGETEQLDALAVTLPDSVRHTYELHRKAFAKRGLQRAFENVVGLVVQPGVDFGNAQIIRFDSAKAALLSRSALQLPNLVFEAHSTDYQTETALRELVAHHFAILKVGPELTFAYREAIFAMAAIADWLEPGARSSLVAIINAVMDENPANWQGYVASTSADEKLFGLSDRIRYYWPDPRIATAIKSLRQTIDLMKVSPGLLSQYGFPLDLPVEAGAISTAIIQHRVGQVVGKYRSACGDAS